MHLFFLLIAPMSFSMPCHVPSVAYIGISNLLLNIPTAFMWSLCSCVTNMASSFAASSPISFMASCIFFPLTPASISILVLGVPAKTQFPLLPLASGQNLTIYVTLLYIDTLLISAPIRPSFFSTSS